MAWETRRSDQINGRNLQVFTSKEDIQWVLDVPLKGKMVPLPVTAVIMVGNEDCPDEVWITGPPECEGEPLISTIFTCWHRTK